MVTKNSRGNYIRQINIKLKMVKMVAMCLYKHSMKRVQLEEFFSLLSAMKGIIAYECVRSISPKYIKQNLRELQGEINNNTVLVGDFNTPLSTMKRASRQNQWGNSTSEQQYEPNGPHLYLQNILSDNSRIHILVKCTWSIF